MYMQLSFCCSAFLTALEEKEEEEIGRLIDYQRRMRSLAYEQGHSPGQSEKTVEVRAYICAVTVLYIRTYMHLSVRIHAMQLCVQYTVLAKWTCSSNDTVEANRT